MSSSVPEAIPPDPANLDTCYNPLPRDATLFTTAAYRVGFLICGIAALVTTLISTHLILKHAQYYTRPSQQRYIIRVCLVVPIYAICAWLTFLLFRQAVYFTLFRDFYEAFAIASFFILLANYIGERPEEVRKQLFQREPVSLPLFKCIKVQPANRTFLLCLKYGTLQYVAVRSIFGLLAVILFATGKYCPENYEAHHNGHPIVSAFEDHTMKKELEPHKPLLKFLSVKLVVFLPLFQDIVLTALGTANVIYPTEYWSVDNISTGLNSLLVSFEMVIFAAMYRWAFPYQVYVPAVSVMKKAWYEGVKDALNPLDIFREIANMFKHVRQVRKEKVKQVVKGKGKEDAAVVETEENIEDGMPVDEVMRELPEEQAVVQGREGRVMNTGALEVDLAALVGVDGQNHANRIVV